MMLVYQTTSYKDEVKEMNKLDIIEVRELEFKLEVIMYFLVSRNGYSFKLYNHSLPNSNEPNSNIIEYMEDVINLISKLNG